MFQSGDVLCSGWTGGAAEEARPALNFWTPSRLFYQCTSQSLTQIIAISPFKGFFKCYMYVCTWCGHFLQNVTCELSTYTNQQMFLCLWCPSKIIQCCRQISWYISDDYPVTTMKIQLNSQMPKESKHLKGHSVLPVSRLWRPARALCILCILKECFIRLRHTLSCYNISSPHSSGPFSENTSNRSLSRCPLSKARPQGHCHRYPRCECFRGSSGIQQLISDYHTIGFGLNGPNRPKILEVLAKVFGPIWRHQFWTGGLNGPRYAVKKWDYLGIFPKWRTHHHPAF